ncbi:MAG: LssY C-terminal domain-containing protein [Acidobacteriaceae bacterium]|nr:LssY C-terminal domain-containing protein [Acidobacteriaceae bacterium]
MRTAIGFIFALLLVGVASALSIPAGTELHVRLTTAVSSERPSGQPVTAVVTRPVFVRDRLALPRGTKLTGVTADASSGTPTTAEAVEQPAKLRLDFTAIDDGSGHTKPIACFVSSVDNARESVDDTGLITGIMPSQTIEGRIEQGIGKIAGRGQQFGQLLAGFESAFVNKVDPSITFRPGVDLVLKLTKPLEWDAPGLPDEIPDLTSNSSLIELVNSEPFRTVAENPPKPSDITNLMFIANEEQLDRAFREAGWTTAASLSHDSKIETARALIEARGYGEAPMSVLTLDGRPPDLTFQKQNNTFAMRHHIRIWRRPEELDNRPVWVAAATHDISITFSPETKTFTHGIDAAIDQERSKVEADLLFTGAVRARALIERRAIPRDLSNATGDKLVTDGKIAVLEF